MPITAIVRFPLPAGTSRSDAKALFDASAPRYRDVAGLVRKYYLFSDNGPVGGGVYLFESQEDADRLYTAEWRASIRQRYGAEPDIQYFENPVIVDNAAGT
jgi:hypothetical protein